jgi:hypothetical protein
MKPIEVSSLSQALKAGLEKGSTEPPLQMEE